MLAAQGYSGTCPSGCWPERGPDGKIYCYCGDVRWRAGGTALRGVGSVGFLGAVLVLGLAAFAGIKLMQHARS